MSYISTIYSGFGQYKTLHIMGDEENHHFCCICGKMILQGQKFVEHTYPAPRRRLNMSSYWHYPDCSKNK